MIEKMRAVSNPLTIIAIFAALAEVVGTVVLGLVDQSIQTTFVWFVMLFPTLIVALFFGTLNFNPKVLYAPSDFKDEGNFLQTMLGARRIEIDLQQIDRKITAAKDELAKEAGKQVGSVATERENLTAIFETYLSDIQASIESTRATAEDLVSFEKLPNSAFQAKIMHILGSKGDFVPVSEIARLTNTNMGESATRRSLEKLSARDIVIPNEDASAYKLGKA